MNLEGKKKERKNGNLMWNSKQEQGTGWKTVTDQCAQWGGNGCLIILVWKHLKSQAALTESRGGVAHRVHIRWSHPCFHVLRPSFETKMWVLNSWFPSEGPVLNTGSLQRSDGWAVTQVAFVGHFQSSGWGPHVIVFKALDIEKQWILMLNVQTVGLKMSVWEGQDDGNTWNALPYLSVLGTRSSVPATNRSVVWVERII